MNWRQLKEFCNNLPEGELDNNVIMWQEDSVISDIEAMELQEDYYMDKEEDEGCYPESEASNGIDGLEKVYDKGRPVLWEDF